MWRAPWSEASELGAVVTVQEQAKITGCSKLCVFDERKIMFQLGIRVFLSALGLAIVSSAAACAEQPQGSGATAQGSSASGSTSIPRIMLIPAFPKIQFDRPIFITQAGDGGKRVYVVEQRGKILAMENVDTVEKAEVFLDISSRVRMRHNEEGLLSLAFHPKFKENGQFFIYYSVSDPKRNRISRFSLMKDDPSKADPDSEQIILEVEQPWGNHNGSTLLFGPDGFLYASFGDGGAANDPDLNGQKLETLLAKIIRIDVDQQQNGLNYAIPKDNPFVDRAGARGEIWAYGLRNVWRMSFDRQTGDLWAADVGQDLWEEVDLIVKGGNYGWNLREGKHEFPSGIRRMGNFTPPDPMIEPVVDYHHREGISITGGYVYRGSKQPRLQGVYLYADYGSRRIWGLRYENGTMSGHREVLSGSESAHITSFGEDPDGELLTCAFNQYDNRHGGRVYRILAN